MPGHIHGGSVPPPAGGESSTGAGANAATVEDVSRDVASAAAPPSAAASHELDAVGWSEWTSLVEAPVAARAEAPNFWDGCGLPKQVHAGPCRDGL